VVYILNHRIELIKRFRPHSATIYDIKIEVAEQFVATASMDGKISIVQLAGGNDVFILDLKRPMMAVAMEPLYHKHPNKRQFISGGLAGNLTLHEKGWLGNKETILHSDEGSIWSVEWKNNLVVWANDTVGLTFLLAFITILFVI
jgi:WD40 repeat protein